MGARLMREVDAPNTYLKGYYRQTGQEEVDRGGSRTVCSAKFVGERVLQDPRCGTPAKQTPLLSSPPQDWLAKCMQVGFAATFAT